ncbi:hypothetical protein SAMN04487779_10479 [Belnapia rosea]|uniref:Uncharacterized protein n=2 Tax=Belnapia rosea TaxID=938405 RepID=A0A1G7DKD5_9PROT|nr:hypothetical protein SAMN04487779_10479 [Belnapia rosea]
MSEERHGKAVLYQDDGWPVRVTGAYLLGAESIGAHVEALRVDLGEPFCGPPPRPLSEQVWMRSLGTGRWARGRLRIDKDCVVFVDKPGADGPERGDGGKRGRSRRNLEVDLLGCETIRNKSARSAVYARLLFIALAASRWRYNPTGSHWDMRRRDAAGLVARVVGAGDYRDWIYCGPDGVLDEEVLDDLGSLGWRWVDV